MKRIVVIGCAVLGLALGGGQCRAGWGAMSYSGYQPWWNICAKRYKCLTPEEERLQKFWHDYYDAMQNFYGSLDRIDWVAYYKNHGYQINGCGPGGGCGRINYAPVFVNPTIQWAVPAGAAGGPPMGPPYAYGGGRPFMGNYPPPMIPMSPTGPYNGAAGAPISDGGTTIVPGPAPTPTPGSTLPTPVPTPVPGGSGGL